MWSLANIGFAFYSGCCERSYFMWIFSQHQFIFIVVVTNQVILCDDLAGFKFTLILVIENHVILSDDLISLIYFLS